MQANPGDIYTVDGNRTSTRLHDPQQHQHLCHEEFSLSLYQKLSGEGKASRAHQRTLARARAPCNTHFLTSVDCQRDAFEHSLQALPVPDPTQKFLYRTNEDEWQDKS